MLIVQENAIQQVMRLVKHSALNEEETFLLHLHGDACGHSPAYKQRTALQYLQTHMGKEDARAFLCEDGDAFVTASDLTLARFEEWLPRFMVEFDLDETYQPLQLCKLPEDADLLLALCEKKLHAAHVRREIMEEKRHQEEEAYRRAALEMKMDRDLLRTLRERRSERDQTEILVIEDDDFTARLVRNALKEQAGIHRAAEAVPALSAYASIAPDLVFLDINLPGISGHDLLEKILKHDPDAYVVMLSANADQANILHAMQCGAKGFVGKPFTKEKLLQYMRKMQKDRHPNMPPLPGAPTEHQPAVS